MDLLDIQNLTEQYKNALLAEYHDAQALVQARAESDKLKAVLVGNGYDEGTINGKNSETRKAQEAALLAESIDYTESLQVVGEAESLAAYSEIDRKQAEAMIGLTKAWLYSQSGVG